MENNTLLDYYIQLERFLNALVSYGNNDLSEIKETLAELCKYFGVSKGVTKFYKSVVHEKSGIGEEIVCYDDGTEGVEFIKKRIVTKSMTVAKCIVYRHRDALPLSEEDTQRVTMIMDMILSFISRNRLEDIVERLTFFDDNGYRNLRSFIRYLEQLNENNDFSKRTAVHFNLRHFSLINREIGRSSGDVVIRNYFDLLEKTIGDKGLICRVGGDNFVAIFKDDILEAYVNVVEFGTSVDEIIGIQSAANFYFRKDVSELTLAESASLAAMLKEPAGLNPLEHPDKNQDRAQWTLKQMWQNGAISDDERELALKELENLKVYGDPEFSSAEEESDLPEDQGDTDWFMDAALNQAEEYIMDQKGIDVEEARQRLYSGGYDIYTTVDYEMQKEMEKRMREKSNFQEWSFDDDKLESGFCCIDYNGNVLCNVSSRKKKKGSRGFNLVSQGKRSPGSCIKPIASYAPALDLDKITYSSLIEDSPIKVDANSDGVPEDWPVNYTEFGESGNWSHAYLPTWKMIAKSLNTAPARLVDDMSPAYCFNLLREKLDITTLVEGMDNDYSGMTVGGLTDGLHLQELVGAYTIFGNGGRKYNTTYISLMEEADGTVVYEQTDGYKHAINDSTAFIMNKMMQKVVTDTDGTGRYAKLNKTTLAAKTGTSSDWVDLNFVGCTPDYVSGVWIGFDEWKKIPTNQYQNIGAIWKNLFGDIADNGEHRDFQMPDSVYEIKYCTKSGNLASSYCGSVDVGYYKDTYAPPYCNGYH